MSLSNACLFESSPLEPFVRRLPAALDVADGGYLDACRVVAEAARESAPAAVFGIFPTHARLNHSHAPNACLTTRKTSAEPEVCVVALQPIAAEEEVCISYGVWDHDISAWAAECLCAACTSGPATPEGTAEVLRLAAADYERLVGTIPAWGCAVLAGPASPLAPPPPCWTAAAHGMATWCQETLGRYLRPAPDPGADGRHPSRTGFLPALHTLTPLLEAVGEGLDPADVLLALCLPEAVCWAHPEANGCDPQMLRRVTARLLDQARAPLDPATASTGLPVFPWPEGDDNPLPVPVDVLAGFAEWPLLVALRRQLGWKFVWNAWGQWVVRAQGPRGCGTAETRHYWRPFPVHPYADALEFWEHGL